MATRKPPKPAKVPMVSVSHMTAVLENIEQQNRVTIEAVQAVEHRLIAHFDEKLGAIEQRLSVLEFVVRKNSDDIRKNSEDIRKNSDAIVALQQEVHRMADILGADRDENAIASLERRVKALEDRVS